MTGTTVIGIDLGGTKIAGALFSQHGNILKRSLAALEGRKGRTVGALLRAEITELLKSARDRRRKVSSLGVSVPGIYHARTGKVWAPNIPGWESYPLRRELESITKKNRIKLTIDSDRACYILGETWQGVAKGCQNAIFLAVGTGIGAGILIDGQILRGAHDIAGAIGWLALERPYRREYVSCGCFEHHASGEGLAKVARELSAAHHKWTAPEVFSAYARGDVTAKQTIDQAIQYWGMAAANLVSLFNPEIIVFGGGVFGPGARFIRDIRREAKKWAQPIAMKRVNLGISKLGGDAGLYGAGFLALSAEASHSH